MTPVTFTDGSATGITTRDGLVQLVAYDPDGAVAGGREFSPQDRCPRMLRSGLPLHLQWPRCG